MRKFPRSERGVPAAFRPFKEARVSSTVGVTRSAKADSEPVASRISSDDARGSLSPEEGSRSDTLLPMLLAGLALILVALGAVFLLA